ncbi:hypothetical protein SAMN00017405_0241 [Desulfonispora thiosulfatigenes DSM 11270]|uniref:Uncharacterized protein n=1 Tax=Desulfonispora thiosulfatigenes DSM 11270 TaxID=656914 RepID=A0A1W1VNU1_DESTI|nr:hypothetical protein [Desulfonispora thiosulfatigenes]SMB94614.1 hypothetical protein SAMN00017405_0241 [Desulfonispora thiosulfatigenes DSM 11270]
MVYYLWVFLFSFFLNDARILYNILGEFLSHIKYKIVFQELGILFLLVCITLNFCKGFFIIFNADSSDKFILALLLLLGNFLGARPGITGGSEFILLWGIWFGYDIVLVKIPLAIFLGIFIIFKNIKLSLFSSYITMCLILLFNNCYSIFFLSFLTLFTTNGINKELFIINFNKLKEKKFFINQREVNDL